MGHSDHDDFAALEQRLRAARSELTPIELDELKRRGVSQSRTGSNRMKLRPRLVQSLLIIGLIGTGGGAVLAATGGGPDGGSSAKDQYCPPNSPNAGQPQGGPGNNCGNPPETCPNGNPKPPDGNCGNRPETCPNGNPKPPGGNCGRSPRDEANKCKEKLKTDRGVLKRAKARHRKYMARYSGAKRARLAKKYKSQERRGNSRATRKYQNCRQKASQAG